MGLGCTFLRASVRSNFWSNFPLREEKPRLSPLLFPTSLSRIFRPITQSYWYRRQSVERAKDRSGSSRCQLELRTVLGTLSLVGVFGLRVGRFGHQTVAKSHLRKVLRYT